MAGSVTGRGSNPRGEKPPRFSALACTLLTLLGVAGLGVALLGAWNNNSQIVYFGGLLAISAAGTAVWGRHFTPTWPRIGGPNATPPVQKDK